MTLFEIIIFGLGFKIYVGTCYTNRAYKYIEIVFGLKELVYPKIANPFFYFLIQRARYGIYQIDNEKPTWLPAEIGVQIILFGKQIIKKEYSTRSEWYARKPVD